MKKNATKRDKTKWTFSLKETPKSLQPVQARKSENRKVDDTDERHVQLFEPFAYAECTGK